MKKLRLNGIGNRLNFRDTSCQPGRAEGYGFDLIQLALSWELFAVEPELYRAYIASLY